MDDANKVDVVDEVDSAPEYVKKTQEEINAIIGREKFEAAEKVRRELETAHKAELDKLKTGQTQAMGGMRDSSNVDIDAIYQQVASKFAQDMQGKQAEEAEAARQAEMQRIADNYFSKLKAGGEKYSDFEEIMGDFDHAEHPQLVYAVSNLENAADVMYELANSPQKLEKINAWLKTMPNRGIKELKNLSDSILQRDNAVSEYQPTAQPLSQIRGSNVSANAAPRGLEAMKKDPRFMF